MANSDFEENKDVIMNHLILYSLKVNEKCKQMESFNEHPTKILSNYEPCSFISISLK